jgi:nucleoporin GLE1
MERLAATDYSQGRAADERPPSYCTHCEPSQLNEYNVSTQFLNTTQSQQLHDVIIPPSGRHPPDIYHALLSSLSKAILLQAETEVTAEKRSAGPLAQVTANLLGTLPKFPEVFFAKLVQRAGGWPVPAVIPLRDVDDLPWKDEDERLKVMGYRKGNGEGLESTSEYISRVAGVMRVYFSILKAPVTSPLHRSFQMPRYWTWFARIMGEQGLLETAVAPQIIYGSSLSLNVM